MGASKKRRSHRTARGFLLSRGWRKAIAKDDRDTAFLAGMARLILAGCVFKARTDTIAAFPPHTMDGMSYESIVKNLKKDMKPFQEQWVWSISEEAFITFYAGG